MTPELALVVMLAASALDQKGHKNTAAVLKHGVRRLDEERDALLEALQMVADADDDCGKDGLHRIPAGARAKIDAAIAKVRAA